MHNSQEFKKEIIILRHKLSEWFHDWVKTCLPLQHRKRRGKAGKKHPSNSREEKMEYKIDNYLPYAIFHH